MNFSIKCFCLCLALSPLVQAATPRLTLFAGRAEPLENGQNLFHWLSSVLFVEDAHPAMANLNHHWLAADFRGIKVFSGQGAYVRREGPGGNVLAMALRPPGSSENNPFHLVFAKQTQAIENPDGGYRTNPGCAVYARDPDGTIRLLAGGTEEDYAEEARPEPSVYRDATGPGARFGLIVGLAMDRIGNVYVADGGNGLIRKITPAGVVTTLAGDRTNRIASGTDGQGAAACLDVMHGIALHQASGDLYVSDGHSIRRMTPAHVVSTILGSNGNGEVLAAQAVGEDLPALGMPHGLHIHGEALLFADTHNNALRSFNLTTRVLTTVAGGVAQAVTREGPLLGSGPGVTLSNCAAIASPRAFGVTSGGTCLVGMDQGLFRLTLPEAQQEAAASSASSSSSSSSCPDPKEPGAGGDHGTAAPEA